MNINVQNKQSQLEVPWIQVQSLFPKLRHVSNDKTLMNQKLQFQISICVFFFTVTHKSTAPGCTIPVSYPFQIITFSTPVLTQPNVVYVQRNLGQRTKLSWLFLLWVDAPTSVAAAAKYVIFFLLCAKTRPFIAH